MRDCPHTLNPCEARRLECLQGADRVPRATWCVVFPAYDRLGSN